MRYLKGKFPAVPDYKRTLTINSFIVSREHQGLPFVKMKDRQGIIRGKCTTPGCECSEYMTPQDSSSARCEYCDHVPVKHVKMIKLGACMKCQECDKYETEEPGSYSNCGYCECPAQHHQGAEKCND